MFEKICSHCGATLLVGLQYCPGCLRVIETRKPSDTRPAAVPYGSRDDMAPNGKYTFASVFPDIEATWANMVYPLKAFLCRVFRLREPRDPPPMPSILMRDEARFVQQDQRSTMSLSLGYTRIVCPECLAVQRAGADVSPSDILTCQRCHHQFPGSFAAEFRKGADLECYRCGITTFCVSGVKLTACPSCQFSHQRVAAKTRVKPAILAGIGVFLLLIVFGISVANRTTPQFFVWLSITTVGSFLGFVTLAALGF